jgi:hypothetical protein
MYLGKEPPAEAFTCLRADIARPLLHRSCTLPKLHTTKFDQLTSVCNFCEVLERRHPIFIATSQSSLPDLLWHVPHAVKVARVVDVRFL